MAPWYDDEEEEEYDRLILEQVCQNINVHGYCDTEPSEVIIRKSKIPSVELASMTYAHMQEYSVEQYRGKKNLKIKFKGQIKIIEPYDWVIVRGSSFQVGDTLEYNKSLRFTSKFWYFWGHSHPSIYSNKKETNPLIPTGFEELLKPSPTDLSIFQRFPGKKWEYIVFDLGFSLKYNKTQKMCRYDCDGKIEYFDQYVDYVDI